MPATPNPIGVATHAAAVAEAHRQASGISDATHRARLALDAAAAAGRSERTLNRLRVDYQLEQLHDRGVIADPYIENGRWVCDGVADYRGARHYTTSEAECFIHGADAGFDAAVALCAEITGHDTDELRDRLTGMAAIRAQGRDAS